MLDRIPRPVQILLLLVVFALGLALGTNALVAKLLTVDPARLAAARRGAPAVVASSGGEARDVAVEDAPRDPSESAVAGSARAAARKTLNWYLDPIVKRNLFDSTNALAGVKEVVPDSEDGEVTRKSDLDAQLLGTTVASDPAWSTALIATSAAGPQVYKIGDQLLTAVVKDILRPGIDRCARVHVENNGEIEYISACDEKSLSSRPVAKVDDKPTNQRGGTHRWEGIKESSPGKFEVEQGEVDYALSNLDKLSREARVVPNFQDGQPNGWKVFSIRRTSALRKMGIKNNDVLTGINGHDLSNTEKALELYGQLQNEKYFKLEILRNGEPMTLEYDIR